MTSQPNAQMVKLTIEVSEEERMYIKVWALKKKMTVSQFIMLHVRPYIPHDEPNEETKQAMRDVDARKNLTRYHSIEEFWKIMGIDPNA